MHLGFLGRAMEQNKLRKIFWGAGILVIFILLVTLIFLMINNQNSVTMKILVTPKSAIVEVNGKDYDNGTYKVPAGSYEVKISKEGFVGEEKRYKVEDGGVINVYAVLKQQDGSMSWYEEHEEDALLIDPITEYLDNIEKKQQKKEYPLLEVLPIEAEYYENNYSNYVKYKIYGEVVDNVAVIKIMDYTGGNYEKALDNIRARGYRPEDYQIIYNNLNN